MIADTPEKIARYRLIALKQALWLETRGMKRGRGPSAYSIVKTGFKFKGDKESVYQQFCEYLEKTQ